MIEAHTLNVVRITPQGTDAVLLSLKPNAAEIGTFGFQPGQYLTLEGGPQDTPQWRCYSITNGSRNDGGIDVLVRRVPGGLVSNWVCDTLRAGDSIRAMPPAGRFLLREPQQLVQLFAGGSGIAPIVSLARQALERSQVRVTLFYANRNRATVMLLDALNELLAHYANRFNVQYWFDEETGLPDAETFRPMLAAHGDAYICGPEPFMQAIVAAAKGFGVPETRIHLESFAANDEQGDSTDSDKQATLEVTIAGATHEVIVTGNETLLAAMLKAGLPVPYACRVGECASCMCRLVEGNVERLENEVLDEDDEDDGWILACRSRARTEKIVIRFP
ncbi:MULTISPECIES: ferredoxin--NADP reductase [Pseudomonadota]|jgi:3-ketosteroid 9alpha-monooxygenase subunit B|nr:MULTISPECIES: ferredoxin--NADP reductase [Pseudomonadota]MCM3681598.1 ferredoxin--NADP reductase [Sphingomonas paucimobilis]|tara:strand:+ start:354 stop:1352 length:999 start_codon:yes stop_codon:yes gene_type:complete